MHFFFHFPDSPDADISSMDEYIRYINHVRYCLERCDCEKESELIFDHENTNRFSESISGIADLLGFVGIYTASEWFDILLNQMDAKYWQGEPKQDMEEINTFYKVFSSVNRSFIDNYPRIFNEICEKCLSIIDNYRNKILLVDFSSDPRFSQYITMIIGRHESKPVLVDFTSLGDFMSIDGWISDNRVMRNYNFADNRHCENHHDFRKDKSPLIGGVAGKTHAASLLAKAIGDKRQREFLINWDNVHDRYIRFEFENENPQNLYHGYHLVSQKTYTPDLEEISLLPSRIVELLHYRRSFD